jgi:hypothetical protein
MSGKNDVVAYPGAAGDADARHDQAALTDSNVVPHLHQIIQLCAAPDYGVVDAAAVDAGVRPNLDFILEDASTHVRNTGVPLSIREISETVAPDDCPAL